MNNVNTPDEVYTNEGFLLYDVRHYVENNFDGYDIEED